MRTISKRTQYGLKAVLALGARYGEGPLQIAALCREESLPIKFLELILLDLKSNGLLESKKGRDVESCGTRIVMRQVRDAIANVLDRTTLADLLRQVEASRLKGSREPLMYHI